MHAPEPRPNPKTQGIPPWVLPRNWGLPRAAQANSVCSSPLQMIAMTRKQGWGSSVLACHISWFWIMHLYADYICIFIDSILFHPFIPAVWNDICGHLQFYSLLDWLNWETVNKIYPWLSGSFKPGVPNPAHELLQQGEIAVEKYMGLLQNKKNLSMRGGRANLLSSGV